MRKIIVAVTAGLLLVAGQAAAANNSAVARVGDRVGARVGGASDQVGGIPLPVLFILGGVIIAGAVVISEDESESN